MDHRHQSEKMNQSAEFVKCLADFFHRNLISIPLIKNYPHQSIYQRCGLRAATLELDTAAYPNIEYLAGTRLSVYPLNPSDHVQVLLKHLIDDVGPARELAPVKGPASATAPADTTTAAAAAASGQKKLKLLAEDYWAKFVQLNGKDSLRLALVYLYDITMAPSRDLVRIMAECCHNKDHKQRLISISQTEESWEKWICSAQRTLKSTFDEFHSCKLSAKTLFSELSPQQPRQYSISSIRSSKRFRAEMIVFQHKFAPRHIEQNLQNIRDRELLELRTVAPGEVDQQTNSKHHNSPTARNTIASNITKSGRSLRSMRSMTAFSSSPISTHQVHQVPNFSGPLMSMYASSTMSSMGGGGGGGGAGGPSSVVSAAESAGTGSSHAAQRNKSGGSSAPHHHGGGAGAGGPGRRPTSSGLAMSSRQEKSMMISTANSLLSQAGTADMKPSSKINLVTSPGATAATAAATTTSAGKANSGGSSGRGKSLMFDGLCSNYLLNLNTNDHIICEFVENPRFTLKGNRERPILMIGQDVGVVAFRPFWQQRSLEHDRAQIFYTLFKDLAPKRFGDMRLVCLTGNRCKIEELFRREINHAQVAKILSSVSYINRSHFASLLDVTAIRSVEPPPTTTATKTTASKQSQHAPNNNNNNNTGNKSTHAPNNTGRGPNIKIDSRDLIELGNVIYKLLIEQNGCLYTCCDPQLTQAIEILTVESIARNNSSLSREKIMTLLPLWKGRSPSSQNSSGSGVQGATTTASAHDNNKYLFTLENQYEKSMIVQEIYDASI